MLKPGHHNSNSNQYFRNAGNMIPHSRVFGAHAVSPEPPALELGCVINKIQHVIVCGHSDCKVMTAF